MNLSPPLNARQRPPRVRFSDVTPVVVRFQDGKRTSGKLRVISVTGGLLAFSRPLPEGSWVRLMFLTAAGPVLGTVEMLAPILRDMQPFRFVALYDDDENRLYAAIQSSLNANRRDRQNIEKHRSW